VQRAGKLAHFPGLRRPKLRGPVQPGCLFLADLGHQGRRPAGPVSGVTLTAPPMELRQEGFEVTITDPDGKLVDETEDE